MQLTNTILNKRLPLLDSGTSYISREGGALIADIGSMGTVTDKWTIATWVKRQRVTASTAIVFNLRNNISNLAGGINFSKWFTGNAYRFEVRNSSGFGQNIFDIFDLPAADLNASWEFFVFTYDYNSGTVLQNFYWDGNLLDETPGSGVGDPYLDHDTVGNPEQTGIDKYIGVGNIFTNDPPGFEGRFFNWSMWDRVLSADEVTTLYNAGNGFVIDYTKKYLDYSPAGLNFHYTFDNGANRGQNLGNVARDLEDDEQGLATYTTIDLPGANDPTVFLEDNMSFMLNPGTAQNGHYINGPQLDSLFASDLNTFSFSLWYKRMRGRTYTQFESLLGSSTNYTTWSDGFGLYWNSNTELQFWINTYNAANSFVGHTIGTGEGWNHIVGVYDGANTRLALYVNGSLAVEDATAISANLSRTGTQNFGLGRVGNANYATNKYCGGFYDQVAVYDKALSDSEITQIYNAGVPSDPSALSNMRLWWTMEEDNGDSDDFAGTPVVEDQSGNNLDGTPTKGGLQAGTGQPFLRLAEDKPTFQSVSAEFSSSTDYIETKSISPYLGIHADDWTAAVWFKPTSTPAATDEPVIFETTDPSDESVFSFYIDDADNMHIKLWDNAGTLFKHWEIAHLGNNVWQHVTLIVDGGLAAAGAGGLTVWRGADTDSSITDITATMTKNVDIGGTMSNEGPQTIRFGNNAAHDTNFPGRIYSVSLWDDDLTTFEVLEIFNMRAFRSPAAGNYKSYTSEFDFEYQYDWRNTYFIGDNREVGRTAPSIDTSVGGVWPPTSTDIPDDFGPAPG